MTHPAWDNLDEFLDPDDFAIMVTFVSTPDGSATGVQRKLPVIFDDPHYDQDLGEYLMNASEPRCTCKAVDVIGFKKRDRAMIDGRAYLLEHDPQPDGVGMAVVTFAPDLDDVP
ncbi:hypothetical protein EO087_01845 [Dyella sp. M7H15-1]|uniref:head-tail joining protein n=1 Tax=Dyella sp. M7H15-1 TaxID=2501295 RepID=UPI0010050537|nr:hypothetical protein [Dyella sp. M7H15-1]QAU22883.1 hypothetical protein EO087_01845 [Dyella sp. M7H15-1]